MKINKQFILEVANGKYSDYDTHGEMQRAAQRILDEKVVGKFQTFCFRTYGGKLSDNLGDIYDAFVDFTCFGAEIKVRVPLSIHPTGYWQVFGMTPDKSLENLYRDACSSDVLFDALCGAFFKIYGKKGLFRFDETICRYAFDKGRISGKQAVEYCRVA